MKSVGLNYNEGGEGLSAAFRHNVDTGKMMLTFNIKCRLQRVEELVLAMVAMKHY
jgi:hypothetical protein